MSDKMSEHCGTCAHLREGVCVRWDGFLEALNEGRADHGTHDRLRALEDWIEDERHNGGGFRGDGTPNHSYTPACPEWRERTVSEAVMV